VYCGEKLPESAVAVPHPVIVVEVLSPSTGHIDASAKLAGYFLLPSVRHYLIVDPDKRLVIHHARGETAITTRIVSASRLLLHPPGIDVTPDGAVVRAMPQPPTRSRRGSIARDALSGCTATA